jgi:RNA recognition motif-containing protein
MNIYVGNLPYTITKDELMDLFVGFGRSPVSTLSLTKLQVSSEGSVL